MVNLSRHQNRISDNEAVSDRGIAGGSVAVNKCVFHDTGSDHTARGTWEENVRRNRATRFHPILSCPVGGHDVF
jgi:hypothetical protein